MAELASLEEVAAADAVGDKSGIGIACDGLEFSGGFGGKALVSVDYEKPGVFVFNLMYSPVSMLCFIATKSFIFINTRPHDKSHTSIQCNFSSSISAQRVINNNIINSN
jgi:hypothetical protein